MGKWSWVNWAEARYVNSADGGGRGTAAERVAEQAAFKERDAQRIKAKLDVDRSCPGLKDGVSYSLGDPEAGRVLKQMRADADAARRVHGLGCGDDD